MTRRPHNHANERATAARDSMRERIDAVLCANGGNTRDALFALGDIVATELQELRERVGQLERLRAAGRKGK